MLVLSPDQWDTLYVKGQVFSLSTFMILPMNLIDLINPIHHVTRESD